MKRQASGTGSQCESSGHAAAGPSHSVGRLPIALTVGEPAGIGPDGLPCSAVRCGFWLMMRPRHERVAP